MHLDQARVKRCCHMPVSMLSLAVTEPLIRTIGETNMGQIDRPANRALLTLGRPDQP